MDLRCDPRPCRDRTCGVLPCNLDGWARNLASPGRQGDGDREAALSDRLLASREVHARPERAVAPAAATAPSRSLGAGSVRRRRRPGPVSERVDRPPMEPPASARRTYALPVCVAPLFGRERVPPNRSSRKGRILAEFLRCGWPWVDEPLHRPASAVSRPSFQAELLSLAGCCKEPWTGRCGGGGAGCDDSSLARAWARPYFVQLSRKEDCLPDPPGGHGSGRTWKNQF